MFFLSTDEGKKSKIKFYVTYIILRAQASLLPPSEYTATAGLCRVPCLCKRHSEGFVSSSYDPSHQTRAHTNNLSTKCICRDHVSKLGYMWRFQIGTDLVEIVFSSS